MAGISGGGHRLRFYREKFLVPGLARRGRALGTLLVAVIIFGMIYAYTEIDGASRRRSSNWLRLDDGDDHV